MKKRPFRKNLVLGILFFLPVLFVLVLSLSKDNYNTLEIVKSNIKEIPVKDSLDVKLKGHLTVLAFFGSQPMDKAIAASNLKELVYDKFKGFKKFQIVVLTPYQAEAEAQQLFKEIATYEDLRFWHFVYLTEEEIQQTFNSLKTTEILDANFASDKVFIIDTDLNQRGRLDDRTDNEKQSNKPAYELTAYDCIEVAEIKNKMSAEDMRVLFTEYREKRKGNFDSTKRRANDLKKNNEQEN